MEILLIRHGQAAGDPYAEPEFPAEGFLSAEGVRQARELGERLGSQKIDHVWASTYGRAMLTARLAMEGRGIPIERFGFLREWLPDPATAKADTTEWEKLNVAAAALPAEQTWKTAMGEGCLEMLARVGPPFLRELEKLGVQARHGGYVLEKRAEDSVLAVFAHGGSLSALLGFLLGMPPFPVSRFGFELTAIARIRMQKQSDVWYPQLVLAR